MAGDTLNYRTDMFGVDELTISFQVMVHELIDAGSLILNQAFVTVFYPETDIVINEAESNIVQTEVVPEPGTVFLFGSGLLGIMALLRKRHSR